MMVAEIQIGGNSFKKVRYFFWKIVIFYENHSISAKHVNFCEFCEKDARFQKGVSFLRILRKRHVFRRGIICIFS